MVVRATAAVAAAEAAEKDSGEKKVANSEGQEKGRLESKGDQEHN